MSKSKLISTYYQRKLPHWHPEGQMFFITFRLANSQPIHIIQELKEEREREQQTIRAKFSGAQQRDELYEPDKKYFGHFDAWLDRCVEDSPRWLADENIAHIVADEIHALDGERYRLITYCIMSNHGHLVVDTAEHNFKPTHIGVTARIRWQICSNDSKGAQRDSAIRHWEEAALSGIKKVTTT